MERGMQRIEMSKTKTIMIAGMILTIIIITITTTTTNQQIFAKSHNPLAKVGKALKNMFGDNSSNNNNNNNNNNDHNSHHKVSEKEQLREENAKLQQQINEMKLRNATNTLGNMTAITPIQPLQQQPLSNLTTANNPLAKVGQALKDMFKKPTGTNTTNLTWKPLKLSDFAK